MALNSTPRTWTTSEVVTAAMMNAEVRDALTGVQSAWTTYAPTWTATSNPAIGNGSVSGAYLRVGKTIHFRVEITMGTTTTYGTGQWRITLPVTPVSALWRFDSNAYDTSANAYYAVSAMWLNAGPFLVMWAPASTAGANDRSITGTSPFTWASGDVLSINGTYETA